MAEVSAEERARRLTHPTAQLFLDTARRLIVQEGVGHAGPIAVAETAGRARGLASYYFGRKDGMLAALLDRDADARTQQLNAALSAAATYEEIVDELVAQCVAYCADGSDILFAQLQTVRSPEVCAAYQRTRARWRGALADQLATKADEGVIDLVGDPQTVAALLTALGRGLADELRADTELELESTVAVARCLIYAALSN